MHIPDNYLSPQTCAVMTAAMIPAWAVSIYKVKKTLKAKDLPTLGVGAALSFLGMMFNIPLPGGTTGHAVGGTLIALLAGPYAACISVSAALLLQALLFGDGGILSFGANCFNMAFVLPFVGYAAYSLIKKHVKTRKGELAAAGIGSYVGINAAALCAAIEFGIQPMLFRDSAGNAMYCPYGLNISIPVMMAGHLTLFGIAEIVYTVAVYAFILKAAPSMIAGNRLEQVQTNEATGKHKKGSIAVSVLLGALICAVPLGLLAEGTAWGEWGTDEIASTGAGYTPTGMLHGFEWKSLLPDYSAAGIPAAAGYILSAAIGAAVLIVIFKLISVRRPKTQR